MNPIIEIAKHSANGKPFAFAETTNGLGIAVEGEPGYNFFTNVPGHHAPELNKQMGLDDGQVIKIISSTMMRGES